MKKLKESSEQKSLLIKAGIITVFILLMLIPISWLKSMINERKNTTEHMIKVTGVQWGDSQTIRGPVIVIPVIDEGNIVTSYAYFLPEELNILGNIEPDKVSKGMVDALCYQSKLNISGTFNFPDISKLNLREDQIAWDKAFVVLSLSSLNGIKNKVDFTIDSQPLDLISNTDSGAEIQGLVAKFPLNIQDIRKVYSFNIKLDLNGMDSLAILPAGRHTSIELKSTWNSVDFIGNFLPNNKDQFPAKWEIFDYNRSFPQMWLNTNIKEFDKNLVGVNLLVPIGNYQKILRSVKYAVLFIVLTFAVFFLIEVLTKKKIHPIQYLLVSFALVMFYTLLLSLSEHIGYDIAYLVAAISVIVMITAYCKSIFRNKKQVIFITLFLSVLYLYLYVVVQSESMSLLFGSIGLFAMLGIVMYVSRNVDWYAIKEPKEYNEMNSEEATDVGKIIYNHEVTDEIIDLDDRFDDETKS